GRPVSGWYFRPLAVRPIIGRDFEITDDTPDGLNVVILTHGLWVRRFGGDRNVIGKPINVSGLTRTIIGILPPSFDNVLDPSAQIWRPLGYAVGGPSSCRTCRHLRVIARLSPG